MLIIQLLTPARSILLTFVYWCAAGLHAFRNADYTRPSAGD